MIINFKILLITLFCISCTFFGSNKDEDVPKENSNIWISAYMASWNHRVSTSTDGKTWGNLVTEEIDWDAFTHMFYFNFMPRADGTLSEVADYHNMNSDRLTAIVSAAHENDTPILFTIGGWDTETAFRSSMSPQYRSIFISNIIDLMNKWGFDGVDLDMEPISSSSTAEYIVFVNELYDALQKETTPLLERPLLTAATNWQPEMFAELDDKFDQINLMTYDMSGAWQGWVTWHNSPLSNGGHVFASNGRPLPSVETSVAKFLNAGVNPKKLGIGIDFYGYVWKGVYEPRQGWESGNAPVVERPGGIPYNQLIEDYDLLQPEWDADALVPYVSNTNPDIFVSFDNEQSIEEKIKYVRKNNLGGAILWELSGGYVSNTTEDKDDVLLQAVKQALLDN